MKIINIESQNEGQLQLVTVEDKGKEYKVHVTTLGLIKYGVEIVKNRVNEIKDQSGFNPYELIGKEL